MPNCINHKYAQTRHLKIVRRVFGFRVQGYFSHSKIFQPIKL